MCGIAGLFQYKNPTHRLPEANLGLRMLEAVAHRGPDDGGLLVAPDLLLGHRRLSILDLSGAGHQPMSDEQQRCWIVFNGEIYNFRELRRELEAAGRRFISQTDTEVILRGYLEWGQDVARRLNGMFAFALYDRREESLWLVRDPIGIKPLFYCDLGGVLRFGSEIKAILADPAVPVKPDAAALDRFFTFGYTPAPRTGFEQIRQLLPGEWLLARSGKISLRQWYQLPYPDQQPKLTLEEAAERLDSALTDAVQRQMVSDVPLGAFLSGGLDSSAIVRSMKRHGTPRIDSFTIGFEERSFDESSPAAEVAGIYGTSHYSQTMRPDAASLLQTVVSHAEEPLADNSAIPVYCLSEFARRQVTVALSGDGADELLAGYATYRASELAPRYRVLPGFVRNALATVVNRLPASTAKYGTVAVTRRFLAGANLPFPYDHCSWRRYVSGELRQSLYTPEFLSRLGDENPLNDYAAALADAPPGLSPLEQQLHLDLRFHLPNDMLVKVDRMSMAHALEVRVPFLDLEVVKTCLAIPPQHKRRGRQGKLALQQLLAADLPPRLLKRKKAGFLIPVEKWLGTHWRPLLEETLTPELIHATGLLRHDTIRGLLRRQSSGQADLAYPLYALLIFGLWWRIWIARELPVRCRPHTAAPVQIVRLTAESGE